MTILECFAQALLLLHISAPPALAITEDIPRKGQYQWSTIMVRPDADCGVVMHEMAHHKQFAESGGPAETDMEWYLREHKAVQVELWFRGRE